MFSNDIKSLWGFHPLQEAYYLQLKEDHAGLVPARVVFASHDILKVKVLGKENELKAKLRGHLLHQILDRPVVGDWVILDDLAGDHQYWPVTDLLPRRSCLKRRASGEKVDVMAANLDCVAIVTSFNQDLNEKRLERALAMIEESQAEPLIVLNKSDLVESCEEEQTLARLKDRFPNVVIFSCSAEQNQGLDDLIHFFKTGQVVAFLGMSGVGKSTLVNSLLQKEILQTQAIRQDDSRGRHTTTHRELFLTPFGFWLLDSPGIREFSFAGDEEKLDSSFSDVTDLFSHCRFRDCSHMQELGCAVQQALDDGHLNFDRWKTYLKMKREIRFHESKLDRKNRGKIKR